MHDGDWWVWLGDHEWMDAGDHFGTTMVATAADLDAMGIGFDERGEPWRSAPLAGEVDPSSQLHPSGYATFNGRRWRWVCTARTDAYCECRHRHLSAGD